jgi:A/G-specific adenine glycosylase
MPWKGEKDPYKIWLSEIILQQTRVEQGLPYYKQFIQSFPTVHHLAKAPLQKILKHWEGLGYYTRARNLHESARHISLVLAGSFPATFDEIKKLKGVGAYTAGAIASFAYDLPFAVLDGNVHRILSRYLGIKKTIQNNADKQYFQTIADQLLDVTRPGQYNQAIMDFGAMCCIPKLPLCTICPLQKTCFAFNQNKIEAFPLPKKRLLKRSAISIISFLKIIWIKYAFNSVYGRCLGGSL